MTNLSASERKALIDELEQQLLNGTVPMGEQIKTIRTKLYGMTQAQYASFTKVSDKTLRNIEKGNTDPRISMVNKLLKPDGFQLSARKLSRKVGQLSTYFVLKRRRLDFMMQAFSREASTLASKSIYRCPLLLIIPKPKSDSIFSVELCALLLLDITEQLNFSEKSID